MSSDTPTPADILRERYDNIASIIDGNNLTGEDERILNDAFLDTAWDYALAAAEADAWRERFRRIETAFSIHEVKLTHDELTSRARAYYPPDFPQ